MLFTQTYVVVGSLFVFIVMNTIIFVNYEIVVNNVYFARDFV